MLQEAHKEFDAGHWDEALARTTLAFAEAQAGLNLARPQYDKVVQAMSIRARDRMLEEDATGISGVSTRLDRDSDLQRLVLVLTGRFGAKQSVLSPEAAKIWMPSKIFSPSIRLTPFRSPGSPTTRELRRISRPSRWPERTRSTGRS